MDLFAQTWAALRSAVAGLAGEDFARPSGCTGWLVRDLVCHLVIDAQDVLITLATPTDAEPTRDAVTYWHVTGTPPTGEDPLDALTVRLAAAYEDPLDALTVRLAAAYEDPLDALTVRLAAAYEDPALLKFHLDDVGSAAGRAATLAAPELRVATQDMVLTAADYLSAYVLEWTLHHLDLVAHLPGVEGPPAAALARTRQMLEQLAGTPFPAALSDTDALLVGTGRRAPTDAERAELGGTAAKLPFVVG